MVVIAWHMLTKQEDYAFTRPSLVREKLRRLELLTGTGRKRDEKGPPTPIYGSRTQRDLDLARQAERAYGRLVRDWQPAMRKGASAAAGRTHREVSRSDKHRDRTQPDVSAPELAVTRTTATIASKEAPGDAGKPLTFIRRSSRCSGRARAAPGRG